MKASDFARKSIKAPEEVIVTTFIVMIQTDWTDWLIILKFLFQSFVIKIGNYTLITSARTPVGISPSAINSMLFGRGNTILIPCTIRIPPERRVSGTI